jgi:hypothetical protein
MEFQPTIQVAEDILNISNLLTLAGPDSPARKGQQQA